MQQLGLPTAYELLEDDARAVQAVWQPFHAAVLRDADVAKLRERIIRRVERDVSGKLRG